MSIDKRPRRQDGSLYRTCKKCKVEPDRCKGFCIFQKLSEKEQEGRKMLLHTGLRDKNGELIKIGDKVKLILEDGEERIFDVRLKTVQRIVKSHPDRKSVV